MKGKFTAGQRWINEMEPEAGLGIVEAIEHRTVRLHFPATGETRIYAVESAPIKRVLFDVGDQIRNREGKSFEVEEVNLVDGLAHYHTAEGIVEEPYLQDQLTQDSPSDLLFSKTPGSASLFRLRLNVHELYHRIRSSSVLGLQGAQMDLIPHQLYIANTITSRILPRALLADEVGLGKTVEAALVLHRLILTGRVNRALIIVPESLVNQWFVELLRRFNLVAQIIDESLFDDESEEEQENPLEQCSLGIISLDHLQGVFKHWSLEVEWDFVIVDEAHHLHWSQNEVSSEYAIVELIAQKTKGILLLTATPSQMGEEGHFARLRLLDPHRYRSYEQFLEEHSAFERVSVVADKYLSGEKMTDDEQSFIREKMGPALEQAENLKEGEKARLLMDCYGPGRVMFRNTRKNMPNFPKRKLNQVILSSENENLEEHGSEDPRVKWIASFLDEKPQRKVLLICKTLDCVKALQDSLRQFKNYKMSTFHEEMTLMQRDRAAAWFAESDGAQILLCSEIGSEGRNFQFVHDLILYDLPRNPELLEQRIGRLDRIGQKETINIHLPLLENSEAAHLANWYSEGLEAFQRPLAGGSYYYETFSSRMDLLLKSSNEKEWAALIEETQVLREKKQKEMEAGRDRLLEKTSFNEKDAGVIASEIKKMDEDRSLEEVMERLFDLYGIIVEELEARTYRIVPSNNLLTDALPGLKRDGMLATYDRQTAAQRDDAAFLGWDHPLVTGAIDLMLGSAEGAGCVGILSSKEPGMVLRCVFLAECVAQSSLYIDRFFPQQPIVIDIDEKEVLLAGHEVEPLLEKAKAVTPKDWQQLTPVLKPILPALVEEVTVQAEKLNQECRKKAAQRAIQLMDAECQRLETLKQVNPAVREEEIVAVKEEKQLILEAISQSRVRLDSLCLVLKQPRG